MRCCTVGSRQAAADRAPPRLHRATPVRRARRACCRPSLSRLPRRADGLEVLIFAWLVTPVLLACFLATTARYEAAHILSSLSIVALVAAIALWTGSVAIAAAWLVLIPLEASLSSSRRVVAISIAIAVGTAAFARRGLRRRAAHRSTGGSHGLLAVLGIVVATLYAGGIAFGAPAQTGIGVDLLSSEEERYRLLARNMSDVHFAPQPQWRTFCSCRRRPGLYSVFRPER